MHIPAELQKAIEEEISQAKELADASVLLSQGYRAGSARGFKDQAQRAAYLATRMPATYVANHRVLSELSEFGLEPESLLDLGAGPGTASWAGTAVFSGLSRLTLLEQDAEMSGLSSRLAQRALHPALRAAKHQLARFPNSEPIPTSDLVICSYFLGELPAPEALNVVKKAWEAALKALVIIEPGSQRGFHLIKEVRAALLGKGASLLAPCPHSSPCPLPDDDWCHFAARLERSALHRRLKKGELSYEDEKFSYLIFTRESKPLSSSRIIRRPVSGSGFVKLTICGDQGVSQETFTKRDKVKFKAARKADWGDKWIDATKEGF